MGEPGSGGVNRWWRRELREQTASRKRGRLVEEQCGGPAAGAPERWRRRAPGSCRRYPPSSLAGKTKLELVLMVSIGDVPAVGMYLQ
uniref:Uncharacterized protein n=1 Tax=Leersia perrieri TaxID=77586 RepID=A0A0D9WA01_9ORYZ